MFFKCFHCLWGSMSSYVSLLTMKMKRQNHNKSKQNFHDHCCDMNKNNRPFSLVQFVFPIQIMWRYSREYFLSKLDIFMFAHSLPNKQDKDSNLLGIVTWPALGKQNGQAKKVCLREFSESIQKRILSLEGQNVWIMSMWSVKSGRPTFANKLQN